MYSDAFFMFRCVQLQCGVECAGGASGEKVHGGGDHPRQAAVQRVQGGGEGGGGGAAGVCGHRVPGSQGVMVISSPGQHQHQQHSAPH